MTIPVETLQALTADNGAFSKSVPGLQTAWDSSSLDPLKTCPRKYYYTMIEGYTSSSIHLDFGGALHKSLEVYDKDRAVGIDHQQALRNATRTALTESGSHTDGTFYPWTHGDKKKNRLTLVRSVIWYLEQYGEHDNYSTVMIGDKPAVELSFSLPFIDGYTLCGHLDKIVEDGGARYILDRKTTGYTISSDWFKKFTPDNQFSLYAAAGRIAFETDVIGVVIDGMQLAVNFTRCERGFALRSASFVDEWLDDLTYWIHAAETYAEARHWPMNDSSCDKYGGCPFRLVCSKPREVRQNFLVGNFERRTWDPTKAR